MKHRVEKALVEISEVLRRHNLAIAGYHIETGEHAEIEFIDMGKPDSFRPGTVEHVDGKLWDYDGGVFFVQGVK